MVFRSVVRLRPSALAMRHVTGCLHKTPAIAQSSFVHPTAVVIGDVTVGELSSIWPQAVIRGDVNPIKIGSNTNVQDRCVIHCTGPWDGGNGYCTTIGNNVSIGHGATLHGCSIESNVFIGMGATVMDGSVLREGVMLAAGTLVPQRKVLTAGLWMGSPAKLIRPLSEGEFKSVMVNATNYVALSELYREKQKT